MTIIHNLALGVALVSAFGSSTAALAQSTEAPNGGEERLQVVVRPDEGLARRSVLARELINLSAGPNFMKEFEQVMSEQLDGITQKGGEEAAWIRTNMPPMLSRMVVRLLDDMVPAYAELYTEEELRGQIDFYRSPVGRSVAAKAIPLGVAVQESQIEVMTSFMTELQSKYCARFDCGEAGQTGAKPSRR